MFEKVISFLSSRFSFFQHDHLRSSAQISPIEEKTHKVGVDGLKISEEEAICSLNLKIKPLTPKKESPISSVSKVIIQTSHESDLDPKNPSNASTQSPTNSSDVSDKEGIKEQLSPVSKPYEEDIPPPPPHFRALSSWDEPIVIKKEIEVLSKEVQSVAISGIGHLVASREGNNSIGKLPIIKQLGQGGRSVAYLVATDTLQSVWMRPKETHSTEDYNKILKTLDYSQQVRKELGPCVGIQEQAHEVIVISAESFYESGREDVVKRKGYLDVFYDRGELFEVVYDLSLEEKKDVVEQLLMGSLYMMLAGVTHGDIKMENIFLKTDSRYHSNLSASLGDWEGAKSFDKPLESGFFPESIAALGSSHISVPFSQMFIRTLEYSQEKEVIGVEKLLRSQDRLGLIDEIAGREILRDHFSLGETLLLVLSSTQDPSLRTLNNALAHSLNNRKTEGILTRHLDTVSLGYERYQKMGMNGSVDQYRSLISEIKNSSFYITKNNDFQKIEALLKMFSIKRPMTLSAKKRVDELFQDAFKEIQEVGTEKKRVCEERGVRLESEVVSCAQALKAFYPEELVDSILAMRSSDVIQRKDLLEATIIHFGSSRVAQFLTSTLTQKYPDLSSSEIDALCLSRVETFNRRISLARQSSV